jgi:hypothetical protein
MISKEVWQIWHQQGVIASNRDLLMMIDETITAIRLLERMYGSEQLTVRALLADWQNLAICASARNLTDYGCP